MELKDKKLVLGTVQFGLNYGISNQNGQMTEQEAFQILDFAQTVGISYLDTAAAYGNSEERIGKYIELNAPVKFNVITKFDLRQNSSMNKSLENSLKNLSLDKVDTIMFHSFDDFIKQNPDEIQSLLQHKGVKFERLGISVYTNKHIEKVCEFDFFDLVQLPYNLLDNHNLRGQYLSLLKENNIEIHVRSVFLQGLLFLNPSKLNGKLKPLKKYMLKLNEIASRHNLSISEIALQYALSSQNIDAVLLGVDSLSHIKENFNLLSTKIAVNVFDEVNQILVNEINLLNPSLWNN